MGSILDFQKKVARLTSEDYLNQLALDQLKKFEDEIVRLNKERLSKGEDIEGSIYGTYSKWTQEIAQSGLPGTSEPRQPKIAGTHYNFEWTGGLFDGMYLKVSNDHVRLWSKDKKAPLLEEEYPDIFGLQPEQLQTLIRERIYPAVMVALRKHFEI